MRTRAISRLPSSAMPSIFVPPRSIPMRSGPTKRIESHRNGGHVTQAQRHAYAERVRAHFLSGVRSGVNGTPTFFINGVRHNGPWDEPSLLEALMSAAHATARR